MFIDTLLLLKNQIEVNAKKKFEKLGKNVKLPTANKNSDNPPSGDVPLYCFFNGVNGIFEEWFIVELYCLHFKVLLYIYFYIFPHKKN